MTTTDHLFPAPLVSSLSTLGAGTRRMGDAGTRGSATHTQVDGLTLHGHVVAMVGPNQ